MLEKNHMLADIVTKSFHNLKLQETKDDPCWRKKTYACRYCDKKILQSQIAKRDEMIYAGEKTICLQIL